MTRARDRNWSAALMLWANGVQGAAFAWGETDCCALVRAALHAMYGAELVPQVPRWGSEEEARRVWATWDLREILRELGAERVPVAHRQGGDVLCWTPAVDTGPWPGIGIALPTGQVLMTERDFGVLILPAYVLPDEAEAYRLPWAVEGAD